MAIIISQNMVVTSAQSGASGKPWFAWRNYVTRGNVVAQFEDVLHPASNLGNTNTALSWRSTSLEEQTVDVELGGSAPIDYIAVARHNLGSTFCEISVEALISGQESDGYVELIAGQFLGTDEPVIIRFGEIYPTRIRVHLKPQNAPPQVAILYVGKLTVMQRGIAQEVVPLHFAYKTEVATGRAESGDFLGRIITDQSKSVSYSFELVDYGWFKREFGDFAKTSLTQPFFFSWLPKLYPDEVGFGWLNTDINPDAAHYAGGIQVNFTLDISTIA